ncbi:hypothetical protein F511_32211 [Dorcoceras hygrometricum]|uniref:Uncharacterized protein n=1 Tax=Dorcoceras hygrometricum TaxID=472368 RepID=A0A2Z7A9C7_9LAMI|nr:hypothetical protein F511_32211 [Dorcoceras hygrometricum]
MHAHLETKDDDIYVIFDGPMKIVKSNTTVAITSRGPQMIEKPRIEWTATDKKRPTSTT